MAKQQASGKGKGKPVTKQAQEAVSWWDDHKKASEDLSAGEFQNGTTIEEAGKYSGVVQTLKLVETNDGPKFVLTMTTDEQPEGANQGEQWAGPVGKEGGEGNLWAQRMLRRLGVDVSEIKGSEKQIMDMLEGVCEEVTSQDPPLSVTFKVYKSKGYWNTRLIGVDGVAGEPEQEQTEATETEEQPTETETEPKETTEDEPEEVADEIEDGSNVAFKLKGEKRTGVVIGEPQNGTAKVKDDGSGKAYNIKLEALEKLAAS